MSTRTTDQIKAEISSTLEQLRTLRDEAKVKVHLAGLDIKTAWTDLQPKLEEAEKVAERAASSATEAALDAIKATASELKKLTKSL